MDTGTGRLVERESEAGRIRAAIERAREGRGTYFVVEGRPGVGKTTLLRVALEIAEENNLLGLSATATETGQRPFGVTADLLGGARGHAGAAAETIEHASAVAKGLFGVQDDSAARPSTQQVIEALYRLTSRLSEEIPLVLVVDDAHWADEATWGFLLRLADVVEDLSLVILVGLRTDEPALAPLPEELRAHPATKILRVLPFSERGVRSFVGQRSYADPSPQFVQACLEMTGGNPLYLREVLRGLKERDLPPTPDAVAETQDPVGQRISQAIVRRLERLGSDAVKIAEAVVVLAGHASVIRCSKVADLAEERALEAAARMTIADILSPEPLEFRYPIVRAAVAARMDPQRLQGLQMRAGDVLHEEGVADEQVAPLLLGTQPGGPAWAADVLITAAARARANGAPAAALRYLERATPEVEERPEILWRVLTDMGEITTMLGRADAPDLYRRALDAAPDRRARGEVYLGLGKTLIVQERRVDAARAFDEGIAQLGDADPRLARDLEVAWGLAAFLEPTLQRELSRRLRPLIDAAADEVGPGVRSLLAWWSLAQVLRGEGRERAVALARRAAGDGAVIEEESADGPSFSLLTGTFWCADELRDGIALSDRALADAQQRGSITGFGTASCCRSWPLLASGRIDDAVADARQAVRAGRHAWRLYLTAAHASLCQALIEMGELRQAEEALTDADASEDGMEYALFQEARGLLRLAQGRDKEALDDLLASGKTYTNTCFLANVGFSKWRPAAAVAAHRVGESDTARALVHEHLDLAEKWEAPRSLAEGLQAAASIASDPDEAVVLLERAVAVLERSHAKLVLIKALTDLGRRLLDSDRNRAREVLQEALDLAQKTRSLPLVEGALAPLVRAGGKPRPMRASGLASLTPEERRVAQLAAMARANREIAEALFVTVKTVERRLTSVYKKLGITSRHALLALQDELNEDSPPV